MYCLKCGSEIVAERVFCDHCLEIMDKYPVKAGTHIQLPRRENIHIQKKQSRRRNLTAEDQVVHLRVLTRTLLALLGAVSVVLGIFVSLYFNRDDSALVEEPPIGQNYTVNSSDGE